jgi:hypothetical protein
MTGSLKYQSGRPRLQTLGELKGQTPEQSKPYQAESRLSTGKTQKSEEFERKYDMSILGNIYIFKSFISAGGDYRVLLRLSSLYKAIYSAVAWLISSCFLIEVPCL